VLRLELLQIPQSFQHLRVVLALLADLRDQRLILFMLLLLGHLQVALLQLLLKPSCLVAEVVQVSLFLLQCPSQLLLESSYLALVFRLLQFVVLGIADGLIFSHDAPFTQDSRLLLLLGKFEVKSGDFSHAFFEEGGGLFGGVFDFCEFAL
jgi:hypothetical protein